MRTSLGENNNILRGKNPVGVVVNISGRTSWRNELPEEIAKRYKDFLLHKVLT